MVDPGIFVDFLKILTVLAHATIASTLVLWIIDKSGLLNIRENSYIQIITNKISKYYRELALLISTLATSGSLYLSEVMGYDPCILCWYQRIFMYPLVLLSGVAVLLRKDDLDEYSLPVALTGGAIASYHVFVMSAGDLISSGCSSDVPCTVSYISDAGYVTIPMMALTAFALYGVLVWRFKD